MFVSAWRCSWCLLLTRERMSSRGRCVTADHVTQTRIFFFFFFPCFTDQSSRTKDTASLFVCLFTSRISSSRFLWYDEREYKLFLFSFMPHLLFIGGLFYCEWIKQDARALPSLFVCLWNESHFLEWQWVFCWCFNYVCVGHQFFFLNAWRTKQQ